MASRAPQRQRCPRCGALVRVSRGGVLRDHLFQRSTCTAPSALTFAPKGGGAPNAPAVPEMPHPVSEEPHPDEWTSASAPSTLDGMYAGPALRSWQAIALDRWRAAGHRGIVEAIMGTGKSLVGVAAIHETVVVGGGKALVLVGAAEVAAGHLHRTAHRRTS